MKLPILYDGVCIISVQQQVVGVSVYRSRESDHREEGQHHPRPKTLSCSRLNTFCKLLYEVHVFYIHYIHWTDSYMCLEDALALNN